MKTKQKRISFKAIISGLVLAAALLLPTVTVKAVEKTPTRDQSKVQLYYDDIANVYHGATSNTIYIKVSKNVKDRQVLLKYRTADTKEGEWETAGAGFFKSLDADYSIYRADISGFGDVVYYINLYSPNGDYIDDNNGKYYDNSIRLGAANISSFRHHGLGYLQITAAVKNLGYKKDVKVRYTTDNWNTYKEAPLSYRYSNDNYETWSTTLSDVKSDDAENFQYCLSYAVNGQTYWDNNFNNNYDCNFYNEY